MRTSLNYSANLFEFSSSLGPVSRDIVHVIVTLGFGKLVLELLFFCSCKLDMVSAELDTTEFGVCPVVTQIS